MLWKNVNNKKKYVRNLICVLDCVKTVNPRKITDKRKI